MHPPLPHKKNKMYVLPDIFLCFQWFFPVQISSRDDRKGTAAPHLAEIGTVMYMVIKYTYKPL